MRKEVKQTFKAIQDDFYRYGDKINIILGTYRNDVEAAKTRCAKYKDEAGELKKEKERLISAARQKVEAADKELAKVVRETHIPKLRAALSEHVTAAADRGFVQTLRDHKDFGLEPSRMELDGLVLRAGGNYAALRMLQSVSGKYKLSFPSADDYGADLDRIEKAVRLPILYSPKDYMTEAAEVFPNQRHHLPNGKSYGAGRPDALTLVLRMTGFESDYRAFMDMGDKWSAALVPEISEFEPIKKQDGESVTPEQQHAEAVQASTEYVKAEEPNEGVKAAQKIGAKKTAGMSADIS